MDILKYVHLYHVYISMYNKLESLVTSFTHTVSTIPSSISLTGPSMAAN